MRCTSCGASIRDGITVCPICGEETLSRSVTGIDSLKKNMFELIALKTTIKSIERL